MWCEIAVVAKRLQKIKLVSNLWHTVFFSFITYGEYYLLAAAAAAFAHSQTTNDHKQKIGNGAKSIESREWYFIVYEKICDDQISSEINIYT